MKSKWFQSKHKAIALRQNGLSIREIETQLNIPRSTLSAWLSDVSLTAEQRNKLQEQWKQGLQKARELAVVWHREQKRNRLNQAQKAAEGILNKIDVLDSSILELALAMLYLGEGSKVNTETALGNSDPLIVKFFVKLLKSVYFVENRYIRCELGLRADQDPDLLKQYWAQVLGLPLSCMKQVNIDKRTEGSKTYEHYKGVCNVRCGRVDIQRRLMFLANLFCHKTIDEVKNTGM